MSKKPTVKLSKKSEISYPDGIKGIGEAYRGDAELDKGAVPYIVMAVCAIIDTIMFYSLFASITYEAAYLIPIEVSGMLFAFDVVPVYLGIGYRRYKAGTETNRFMLCVAAFVFFLAGAASIYMRYKTRNVVETDSEDVKMAIMVFNMIVPFLTTLGSFYISYSAYNPIRAEMKKWDLIVAKQMARVQNLTALVDEYDSTPDFYGSLLEEDNRALEAIKKEYYEAAIYYAEYVRLSLAQHLGSAADVTAVTVDDTLDEFKTKLKMLF